MQLLAFASWVGKRQIYNLHWINCFHLMKPNSDRQELDNRTAGGMEILWCELLRLGCGAKAPIRILLCEN